jgi:hypothetical protein
MWEIAMKPGLQSSLKHQPRGMRRCRGMAVFSAAAGGWCVLWAASACQAQAVSGKVEAAVPRIELGAAVAPAPGAAPERNQTHLKLWLSGPGNGLGGLGIGLGRVGPEMFPSAATAGAPQAASWSWSLRRDLGSDSRVVVEQVYAPGAALQSTPHDVRLALELKPNDALKRFGVSHDSLMRMPLSGTWTLSMRPRSGGVALMLRTPL